MLIVAASVFVVVGGVDILLLSQSSLWKFMTHLGLSEYVIVQLQCLSTRVQPHRVSPQVQFKELCKCYDSFMICLYVYANLGNSYYCSLYTNVWSAAALGDLYSDSMSRPRIPLMLITWNHSTSEGDRDHIDNGIVRYGRLELHQQALHTGLAAEWIGYPRSSTWEKMTRYSFVLSPLGAGFDCHRTWEALLLGAIVIAIRSPISIEYEQHDLPIVFVDNFSFITKDYLRNLESTYRNRRMSPFDVRATRMYWLSQHTRVDSNTRRP